METNNLINDFHKIYKKYQSPYKFNILNEQQGHIVENSHTNILMKILQYKEGDSYPFLKSFCDSAFSNWSPSVIGDIVFKTEHPCLDKGRIDGLIYKEKSFAIIIENKINGANDQKNQLCRYIKNVKEVLKFNNQQIWVIYLTANGGQPTYLEDLAGEMSCMVVNEDDHNILSTNKYASITYSADILDWLKDYVLPNVRYNTPSLVCGLSQYIDYLEERFTTKDLNEDLVKETFKYLDKNYNNKYKNKVEQLHKLYNSVSKQSTEKKDDNPAERNALLAIIEKYKNKDTQNFAKISCDYFSLVLGKKCHVHSHFTNYYINIYCQEKWEKDVFFSWYPNNLSKIEKGKELSFCIVFRKGRIQKIENSPLRNLLKDNGYEPAVNDKGSWRKTISLVNEGWTMLDITDRNKLIETYKRLVPEELIKAIDNL